MCLVSVSMGCERLLARSTGKAGKQARRWLSPVEDVIALPSTQALPLTFKLWKHDIRGLTKPSLSYCPKRIRKDVLDHKLVAREHIFWFRFCLQVSNLWSRGDIFVNVPIRFSLIILQFTFFQMINAASHTIMELNKPQTSWHQAGFNAAFPKHWQKSVEPLLVSSILLEKLKIGSAIC